MKVSINELYDESVKFLKENYNLELGIPIEIAPKLRSTFGQMAFTKIRMSETMMFEQSREMIIDVLRHELIHYALWRLDKPYRDKDDYFKSECDRLNVSRTRTYQYKGKVQVYACKRCYKRFNKKMKGYHKRYSCRCGGSFKHVGEMAQK